MGLILGFDPGGRGRFGWSVCSATSANLQPPLETGLADDALDAFDKVKNAIRRSSFPSNIRVLAAGIDAPMFWSISGTRTADKVIRQALRSNQFPSTKLGGAVQEVNSLRGACLVQGLLLGRFLREMWEHLDITETHPKALECLLRTSGQPDMVEMVERLTTGLHDHERDATLAAIGAWPAYRELPGWQNLYSREDSPVQPFGASVSYWMPMPRTPGH